MGVRFSRGLLDGFEDGHEGFEDGHTAFLATGSWEVSGCSHGNMVTWIPTDIDCAVCSPIVDGNCGGGANSSRLALCFFGGGQLMTKKPVELVVTCSLLPSPLSLTCVVSLRGADPLMAD